MVERKETKQSFVVRLDENKGGHSPLLNIESEEGIKREIPVYSVREPLHHKMIARSAISGKVVLFEVGVIGFMIAVSNDPAKDGNSEKFWELKRGRDRADKVPIMMLPEDQDKIVDFDKLHPDYHYLKDPKNRQKFFGTFPIHTILPLREEIMDINRDVFVTTLEDTIGKPADQFVSVPTVCVYSQGGDKTWETITKLASSLDPNVYLGISSFNDHGEHSPYDFGDLIEYVQRKQRVDFDYVVRDPIVAKYNIRSSMTQIRLPLKGETPEIRIVRKGPVGIDMLRQHARPHSVMELASAEFASNGHPGGIPIADGRINAYLAEANS